jgi:hypothetical protein
MVLCQQGLNVAHRVVWNVNGVVHGCNGAGWLEDGRGAADASVDMPGEGVMQSVTGREAEGARSSCVKRPKQKQRSRAGGAAGVCAKEWMNVCPGRHQASGRGECW